MQRGAAEGEVENEEVLFELERIVAYAIAGYVSVGKIIEKSVAGALREHTPVHARNYRKTLRFLRLPNFLAGLAILARETG